ncbi:MAG TPA: peptidoglycan-associated lipoprotein Pal [Polyangia bacterium]|jgi:peptidoglycan-associated lipoprotein
MRRIAFVVPVLLAFGCAHKPEQKQSTTTAAATAPSPAEVQQKPVVTGCSSDLDCSEKQLCIRGQCVDISAGLAECSHVRVHFELNSSDIADADKTDLQRSARCLKADQALHVSIEGNADERGTEEYNLALGDKRATAVRGYLESLGASETQLKTVSYGKEKPLCTEHDEECWAQNRRAELKVADSAPAPKKHHHKAH